MTGAGRLVCVHLVQGADGGVCGVALGWREVVPAVDATQFGAQLVGQPPPLARGGVAGQCPRLSGDRPVLLSAGGGHPSGQVPFLPDLVPALERHGHLVLTDDLRLLLLAVSPATADRLLRPIRQPQARR